MISDNRYSSVLVVGEFPFVILVEFQSSIRAFPDKSIYGSHGFSIFVKKA
jgi:hypothetical protein